MIDKKEDVCLDQLSSAILRIGVLIAGAVVIVGGVLLLLKKGSFIPDYGHFDPQALSLNTLSAVTLGVLSLDEGAIIQLGLILLILVPIFRVVVSIFIFAKENDYLYAGISLIVFLILAFSVFSSGY